MLLHEGKRSTGCFASLPACVHPMTDLLQAVGLAAGEARRSLLEMLSWLPQAAGLLKSAAAQGAYCRLP